MRTVLTACSLFAVLGMSVSAPSMAGSAPVPPDAQLCDKTTNAPGLTRDLAKLMAVMSNRCSNAGTGNGGEKVFSIAPGKIFSSPNLSEADDVDPGNSKAHNNAAKTSP